MEQIPQTEAEQSAPPPHPETQQPDAAHAPARRKRAAKPAVSPETLAAIATQPYRHPESVVTPGDDSEAGARYADTALDDGRQRIPWNERHETLMKGVMASAVTVPHPLREGATIAVTPNAPVNVYLIGDDAAHEFVIENGRQRRRVFRELNSRLAWVCEWLAAHPELTSFPARRKALLADDVVADRPWLTLEFVQILFGTSDLAHQNWVTVHKSKSADGADLPPTFSAPEFWLTVHVGAVNPDLADMSGLLASMTRQDNSVPTPRAIRAQNFARLRDSGKSLNDIGATLEMSGDTVLNDIRYLQLIPEVRAALDSDRMSFAVAVSGGGRHGAFFTKVDNTFVAVSEDNQRAIWAVLNEKWPVDSDGEFTQIKGKNAKAFALKVARTILSGKAWDEAADKTPDEAPDPGQGAAEGGGETEKAQPQKKGAPRLGSIDRARLDEHIAVALSKAPDPDENGLTDRVILERTEVRTQLSTARAIVAFLAGDRSVLKDLHPALRDALIAATAEPEATAIPASVEEQAVDLVVQTIDLTADGASVSDVKVPRSLSDGSDPTPEAVALAEKKIAACLARYDAASGVSVHDFLVDAAESDAI